MLKRLCPSLRKNTFPSLGHSCKEIRNADSHVKDGEYWIDLKKNGNLSKVYCDMETEGGKERIFKKNIKITVLFLLLPKPSFYNKWNAISFCKIKNLISFHFFFPGGWLLVSNVVVDNLSSPRFSEESWWNKQLSQQVLVTHGRCHEGTENTLVFHSVEIPLQQKKGTYSPFDHGCQQQRWSSSTILQWSDRCQTRSMWLVCEDEGRQLKDSCWL